MDCPDSRHAQQRVSHYHLATWQHHDMSHSFRHSALLAFSLAALTSLGCSHTPIQKTKSASWAFAVAGDSRDCGNVVMPAIADGARRDNAVFFWHLGDLRAIYRVDEDFASEKRFRQFLQPPGITDYVREAWTDFTLHQVVPFGQMPFYLGIGNHETIPPKTVGQYRMQFRSLLDRPELRAQRARDLSITAIPRSAADQTYFHWVQGGVDFITLDNASADAFDDVQLVWFDAVLAADRANAEIKSIVVGMHEALPYSKSDSHSMCSTMGGIQSGLHVYSKLVETQRSKSVYVLASQSHYYLADIFNTAHWHDASIPGGVLPGWVVGTAGAERYPLPPGTASGPNAREHTYGYLIGSVAADGHITFAFRELTEADLQRSRSDDIAEDTVTSCVVNNPTIEAMHARTSGGSQCELHMAR